MLRRSCLAAAAGAADGSSGGHPLRCRALELCFSVALDRLPSSGAAAGAAAAPAPSNALVAALKRAQAQQRKGSLEAQQQPLLAVKVELPQLVLSILDDPSVSRVMKEASFSSSAVKAAIEQSLQSQPPVPAAAAAAVSVESVVAGARRACIDPKLLQPTFGGSAVAANAGARRAYVNPKLQPQLQERPLAGDDGSDDEVKRLFDAMVQTSKRNPILVGDGDGLGAVLKTALHKIAAGDAPAPLKGANVIELGDLGVEKAEVLSRIVELGARVDQQAAAAGVVVHLGDLNWLIEGPAAVGAASSEAARVAVGEIARLLRRVNGEGEGGRKMWLVGMAASATYLRCTVFYPSMEAEWDLLPVSIACRLPLLAPTRLSGGMLGSSVAPRGVTPASCTPPWVPLGSPGLSGKPAMCAACTSGYERELAKLVAEQVEKSAASELGASRALPHWLKLGTEPPNPKQQELEWKKCTDDLHKRWTSTCARLHAGKPPVLVPLGACSPRSLLEPKPSVNRGPAMLRVIPDCDTPALSKPLEGRPGSLLMTDLVLGRPENFKELQKEEGLSDLQRAKIAGVSDIDLYKRILKGLTEKVSWQSDAASTVAAVVEQCRSGGGKLRGLGPRGEIWMLFIGPDKVGKLRMAGALSEILFNVGPAVVSIAGGDRQFGSNAGMDAWGRTSLDCVAEVVRQNPFAVIVIEGVDRADALVCRKIRRAMERGRLADSRGGEVTLGNCIFLLTADLMPDHLSGSQESSALFEEKMLEAANSRWQLELSIGDHRASKHRPDWLCNSLRPTKMAKDVFPSTGLSLDLSLAVPAPDDTADGSLNSSDITVEHEPDMRQLALRTLASSSAGELTALVEDTIVFCPVDFTPMRKKAIACISAKLESIIGRACSLKIDDEAVDRIVGGLWVTGAPVEDWVNEVLAPSIVQLKTSSSMDPLEARPVAVGLSVAADNAAKRRAPFAGDRSPPTTIIVSGISKSDPPSSRYASVNNWGLSK